MKQTNMLLTIGIGIVLFIGLLATLDLMATTKEIKTTTEEPKTTEVATFAAGCFWCVEAGFENYLGKGVIDVVSGYTNGTGENPTYTDYYQKGHMEAVEVTYDPGKITYNDLLEIFWRQFDPTDPDGSFGDRGFQYSSAIFYHTSEQKKLAEASIESINKSGLYEKAIVTPLIKATKFWPAEDYHQDYHTKNPVSYKTYRYFSGRDQFRESIWGSEKDYVVPPKEGHVPTDEELREMLTPLQYKVTQLNGTEEPFNNEYWNNTEEGIYVDIVSGEPLFSSTHKYKSGTGWPSFTEPLEPDNIVKKKDYKLIIPRTEVRSKRGDSHVGHVFNDGPKEAGGKRYCMNSAALRFIPKENLEKEGYGEYVGLFEN